MALLCGARRTCHPGLTELIFWGKCIKENIFGKRIVGKTLFGKIHSAKYWLIYMYFFTAWASLSLSSVSKLCLPLRSSLSVAILLWEENLVVQRTSRQSHLESLSSSGSSMYSLLPLRPTKSLSLASKRHF